MVSCSRIGWARAIIRYGPYLMSESDPLEQRVSDLLQRLTLAEKVSLCAGKSLFKTQGVPRLGIAPMKMTDGPRGIAFHSALHRCTAFPSGIAQAASWNESLLQGYGEAVGDEASSVGARVLLGPAINITRTPLNGRTFEYLSEDPYLNARLAVPIIRGIQQRGVAACVKHLAVNNQETNRVRLDAKVSEQALEESYLPAFKAAVETGGAWSVMAAYNALNGFPCCESEYLLQHKLRNEWGFRGFVVSDWFAARRTSSAQACLRAGLNLEMPGKGSRLKARNLRNAVAAGQLTEAELDGRVADLLRVMALTGHLDNTPSAGRRNTPAHQQLARTMAEESFTLLKNRDAVLPLAPRCGLRIALLGPKLASRNCFPLWGGSAGVWPPYEVTPLAGMRRENKGRYTFVRSAEEADVAVVFAGLSHRPGLDSEGVDRKALALPGAQDALIRKTAAVNPNTVVVLLCGAPVAMPWLNEVAAVMMAWYPGMEGGSAIARVLFGDAEPGGRLPVTFPARLADSPAHRSLRTFPGENNVVHYDEACFVGYRYADYAGIAPLFPFGHGLTYTRFAFSDLLCELGADDEVLRISCQLTNTGQRAGSEVAQLYIGSPVESCPPQALKGFVKVRLAPGERRRLDFEVPLDQLAHYDEISASWVRTAGDYRVHVGRSSRDVQLSAAISLDDW